MTISNNSQMRGLYRARYGANPHPHWGALPTRTAAASPAPRCTSGFKLLLLLVAILIVRPGELIEALEGWPIYQVVILLCLSASLPAALHALRWPSLVSQPAHLCILGLLPAIVLSHLSHGDTYFARIDALDFVKSLVFYFLLIGLLTTRLRLEIFMVALLVLISTVAALSLLTYHGALEISSLDPIMQNMKPVEGDEVSAVPRLLGAGIFNDPNDFSLVLVAALMIGSHLILERPLGLRCLLLLPLMAGLAYAFYLTRSRGGFLALIGASVVFLFCRYPWRRAVMILILAAPLALVAFGGRQTDIDLGDSGDTAQGRIHLWRDSMVLFHQAPLFGIGSNRLADVNGIVAHNSYVQAYAELGLVGGTLFIGALSILASDLFRLCQIMHPNRSRDGYRWSGCVFAILIGYMVGLFSLTRNYEVSTYLILGLAAAFAQVLAAEHTGLSLLRKKPLIRRIALASVGCVIVLECCARFLAT